MLRSHSVSPTEIFGCGHQLLLVIVANLLLLRPGHLQSPACHQFNGLGSRAIRLTPEWSHTRSVNSAPTRSGKQLHLYHPSILYYHQEKTIACRHRCFCTWSYGKLCSNELNGRGEVHGNDATEDLHINQNAKRKPQKICKLYNVAISIF